MCTSHVARTITHTIRQVRRSGLRPFHLTPQRALSTKHPKDFVPPTKDDLTELRDRVQDFTRKSCPCLLQGMVFEAVLGREIPEEVAAKTDRENAFPSALWRKLGEAGYDASRVYNYNKAES